MKIKKNDSNYPKKQNFLGEMNKTKLQNINKCIKRWKTKTTLTSGSYCEMKSSL